MSLNAILVGNSDGIGLALTRRLLAAGWAVSGLSRSASAVVAPGYRHVIADVTAPAYSAGLGELVREGPPDLCVYLAGIGEMLDPLDMSPEARVFDVNLTGMVRTASVVIPAMVRAGRGHFIGISSLADELTSAGAPSYHASKAGFSNYLAGLARALKPRGVQVTNVRFGFVDTKMAKGTVRPFMMSVERAADHLERCIRRRPRTCTAPLAAIPLVKALKLATRLGLA